MSKKQTKELLDCKQQDRDGQVGKKSHFSVKDNMLVTVVWETLREAQSL